MPSEISILGIRHHGPGSARMVMRALERIRPDAVLIEGPPEGAEVLHLAANAAMRPPVALLVYEPDEPKNAVYYPFASFSPEWRAILWGQSAGAPVRFIDLPQSQRACERQPPKQDQEEEKHKAPDHADEDGQQESPDDSKEAPRRSTDPLDLLAETAGFSDGEAWWGKLIEERRGDEDPLAVFDSIREAMGTIRADLGDTPRDTDEPAREAHMRKCIRAAVKEGFGRIAVICGAWHAPVLTAESLKALSAKEDDAILKGLPKRKVAATWIPWTYERLSMHSGYGAGVVSPGWYDHLWLHHEHVSERWMTRVARLMRDEDLDAPPASVIESVRLADSLAALRGRSLTSLDELGEATLSILCHGNPMPMQLIHSKLIVGTALGEVPEDAPSVPLQRDLAALQKSLRMKVSADEQPLDLDQRKENDLAKSRLLHRLCILGVTWGKLLQDQVRGKGTFRELWQLQWLPELSVSVIVAARWGNTVEQAADTFVRDRAANAQTLTELTSLLDDVMLADLPGAVECLMSRIQAVSAVGTDVGHLMEALPPLARVLRYGNVRKVDAEMVEPVVSGILARICSGLLPACVSLDDRAAEAMRDHIDDVHSALSTLNRTDPLADWHAALRTAGDADIHGVVAGRCWRLLLDAGIATPGEAAARLTFGLSRGNDPAKASAWLEGFLAGSGSLLAHDDRLLTIVDRWLSSLSRETFELVVPIVRRTFSTFEKPERRQIGETLRRTQPVSSAAAHPLPAADDYDDTRGSLVDETLRLILGDRFQ